MLALSTLALMRHPEQLRVPRDRPDRVDAAVEELLRWLTIVNADTTRVATEPVELAAYGPAAPVPATAARRPAAEVPLRPAGLAHDLTSLIVTG